MEKKKEFTYRGKNLEEIKKLSLKEFADLLISRQRRTLLRNLQETQKFLERVRDKSKRNKRIKTHKRNIVIVPELVGKEIYVYKGNGFEQVKITEKMIGHKLGEFVLTRTRVNHGSAGVGATKGTKHKSMK